MKKRVKKKRSLKKDLLEEWIDYLKKNKKPLLQ